MIRTVNGAGSVLLRGLGPSGLLVSRGLGGQTVELSVTFDVLRRTGGSGSRPERQAVKCIFLNVKLVTVNGKEIADLESHIKVCYDDHVFKIKSSFPKVVKKISRIKVEVNRMSVKKKTLAKVHAKLKS